MTNNKFCPIIKGQCKENQCMFWVGEDDEYLEDCCISRGLWCLGRIHSTLVEIKRDTNNMNR